MSDSPRPPAPRIAVIGGGISGLAAAHRLRRLLPHADVHLFEASDRLGGPLHTLRAGESILEQGADSFLIKTPWALDLCRELGLADELVPVNERHRRALVVRDGKLLPVPDGFVLMRPQNLGAMLRSPVLSLGGKLRLMAEPLVRAPAAIRDPNYDESVASFATRRLGRETFERLVQPLVAGIFVADANRLSLAATFPEFLVAEWEHGSLWRSARAIRDDFFDADEARKRDSGARYGQFVSLRGGLRTLIDTLAESLPAGCIHKTARVEAISRVGAHQWVISTGELLAHKAFDGVILATPTHWSANLIKPVDVTLAQQLTHIEYASSVVVTLVYRRDQIAHPLDGFGVVVPAIENRPIVAASLLTVKFPAWAPKERAVIRVFMGGVLRPEMVERDDAALVAIAIAELSALVGASGEPIETHIARWRDSMPQYHVGHVQRVAEIESRVAALPGLQLAGSGYRGVGIPQCIRSGRTAAEKLVEQPTSSPGGTR